MNIISKIVLALVVVGGLNWGLIGVFNFDLVAFLFGPMSILSRTIYILVGLAAIWTIFGAFYMPQETLK